MIEDLSLETFGLNLKRRIEIYGAESLPQIIIWKSQTLPMAFQFSQNMSQKLKENLFFPIQLYELVNFAIKHNILA